MISGWWITGLMDGEASFGTIDYLNKRATHRCLRLLFQLNLRADDAETVFKVRNYFGCGQLRWSRDRCAKNPSVRLKITSKEGIGRLVAHLKRFPLQSKKKYEAILWVRLAELVLSNQHHQKAAGYYESRWLAEILHSQKAYNILAANKGKLRIYEITGKESVAELHKDLCKPVLIQADIMKKAEPTLALYDNN